VRTSPYRSDLSAKEPELRRPVPPARPRARRLLARCVTGSLLLHGALMASSASVPTADAATLENAAPARWVEEDAIFVTLHPDLTLIWSPPRAVAECFDANVIDAMRGYYAAGWSEVVAFSPFKLETWAEIESLGDRPGVGDPRRYLMNDLFDECAVAAKLAGVDPDVRYDVLAKRSADGSAHVAMSTAFGPDLDERVQCCRVKSAQMLVSTLQYGDELRYEGATTTAAAR
jgi:hypothetical protein